MTTIPNAVPLLDAAAAAAGDQAAVDAGDTWAGLMERAAGHLARGVVGLMGRQYGLKVAILVGKGNNGGDGWAAARRLTDMGARCRVVSTHPLDVEVSDEAAANRSRWIDGDGWAAGLDRLGDVLSWADVAVDALLGTGISGAPRGDIGDACKQLRQAREDGLPIVACDIPSGVSSDDGSAPDPSVVADLTVTFGGLKTGLVLYPGIEHAGRVIVGGLGPRYQPPAGAWRALTATGAAPPPLASDASKRTQGVVMIVAGSVGAAGAAMLCTRGALEAGAGLVTLACPAHIQRVVAPLVPSAMTQPLAHQGEAVSAKGAQQLDFDGMQVVVAGPGLTPSEGTRAVVDRLLAEAPRVVLDADAINVFRDDPDALADHAGPLVLTPHERELSRIVPSDLARSVTGAEVLDGETAWRHRVELVPQLAERLDATIVAKGPGTIVAAPDGRMWVTPVGGPALGVGGSGDVLAGIVGQAVATADDIPAAVAAAVWRHGFAGDYLGQPHGGLTSEALALGYREALTALAHGARERPAAPFHPSALTPLWVRSWDGP